MLYTSYFANMKNIPKNMICVSICGGVPKWYTGLQYKKVAPKYKFFMEWKENHNNDYYIEHFNDEVLSKITPQEVVKDLEELTGQAKDIVLLCYEKPNDFCHRHLVSEWLRNNGLECKEFEK